MAEQDQTQDESIETQEVETTERDINPEVQAMFDEAVEQLDEEYGIERETAETEEEETTAVEESGEVVAETEEEPAEPTGEVTAEEGTDETLSEFQQALAKSYGLTDSDLEGMSPQELQRALRLIEVARGPQGQQSQQQAVSGDGANPPQQQPQQPTQPVTDSDIDALIEKMRDEGYGDEQIQFAETMARQNKQLQEQMQQQQQAWQQREMQMQQARQTQEVNDFVAGVNSHIKEPDLFGNEQATTPQQADNLRMLWQQANVFRDAMAKQGRFVPLSDPQLLQQAAKFQFGSHFTKKERAAQLASAKKQSARRMGSPSKSKPNDKPSLPWDGTPETDPELKKFASERGLQM